MSAAVWGTPWHLRLVALDIETCVAPDNAHRIVSLGVAVCRDGEIKQRYEWLVNPGVPLDGYTPKIHKLTDRHLADEPTFDEILPELRKRLIGKSNERVVLAAHNAGFDVGWLRSEVARVKAADLPDLPILDTQAGGLLGMAGLTVRQPKLATLLKELGLENEAPHRALGDATAAARAAIELIQRAEDHGHRDLDLLLAAAGGTSAKTIRRRRIKESGRARQVVAAPAVPPAHVATHADPLPANPTPKQLADSRGWIAECARLRCDALAARVGPEPMLRGLLLDVLDGTASAGDRAGTATVLGALLPMLGHLPDSIAAMRQPGPALVSVQGARHQRGVALALHVWLEPRLVSIGRCPTEDPCPACREGEPCPLDVWRTALVPSVLGLTTAEVEAFWDAGGAPTAASKARGRGYLSVRRSAPALADVALRACLDFWRAKGERTTASLVAEQVWQQTRTDDPAITEVRANTIANSGRPTDLRAALRICHAVLGKRDGSTDPAWASLATRTAQLAARARRTKTTAEDRHQARRLNRPPPTPRFLRASA